MAEECPPPTGPEPSVFEQEAAKVADLWHGLGDFQREHMRRDAPELGQALDDLLETLVEDT